MTPDQVAEVLGTMTTAATVAILVVTALRLVAPGALQSVRAGMSGTGPTLGASVALIATAGSLWFSEGAHFPPCELCWYQRIAMYPLAVILPLAAWRGDPNVRHYGLALAGAGLAISAWHNVIETFPSLDRGSCDAANPCTIRWVEGLGFWTIPRMAFVAFVLIITTLALDTPATEDR